MLAAGFLAFSFVAAGALLSAESQSIIPRRSAPTPPLAPLVLEPVRTLIVEPVKLPRAATKRPQRPKRPITDAHTHSSRVSAASGSISARLACIRGPESGGNYAAVSASGKYRGAYQFDQQTWRAYGGSGDPAAASREEQDRVAENTIRADGGVKPGRWPTPARRGC